MQRFIRLSLLMVLIGLFSTGAMMAKPQAYVSGTLNSDEVRVFLKDSTYIIDRDYMVSGTLIVEPGTEVLFYPNGRIVVREGGRFIADGQAHATYEPGSLNPLSTSNGYTGYADPNYFLSAGVVNVKTVEELTVNRAKENIIFNVTYNVKDRTIEGLQRLLPLYSRLDGADGEMINNDEYIISYEQALMLAASRINEVEVGMADDLLNINEWSRIHGESVNIIPETITFKGQPALNSSREWGHIVVLPGARAAFFRSVDFVDFRKEITVDRADFYDNDENGTFANYKEVNKTLKTMTNGAGGALTTLSSRTWLLECNFEHNMARLRGGAVQFLEAPEGYPMPATVNEYYALDKNPVVVNRDNTPSEIIYNKAYNRSNIRKIDCIDEDQNEPLSDIERRAYDDARLAIYLGRVRNLNFEDNYTLISNTKLTNNGVVDDKAEVADEFDPVGLRHISGGGAMFISSSRGQSFGIMNTTDMGSFIEFALGCNDVIKMNGVDVNLYEGSNRNFVRDAFVAKNNYSESYAEEGEGSMGGAIYLSYGTSMIFAGQLDNNSVKSPFELGGDKARGGAVFVENSAGSRVQFRGTPAKSEGSNANPTHITNNKARFGGAVYVDGYSENIPASPVIGGSDVLLSTRDWGFDIVFEGNEAGMEGGAIYTKRQMVVNGAGGVEGKSLIGYGGLYPVKFYSNTAAYSGGAIKSNIPPYNYAGNHLSNAKKVTKLVRAEFIGNKVGIPALKDSVYNYDVERVAGGGAFYGLYTELDEIKGCLFENNTVLNGNGAAIALIQVEDYMKHAWVTDLDVITRNADGEVESFTSVNDVFTTGNNDFPADVRMMTRFINNVASVDPEAAATQMGSGTTQVGLDGQNADVVRFNPDLRDLPENGIGLGGAIYVADDLNWLKKEDIDVENDELFLMNRVRMIGNEAYTGSAIYSDAYNVTFVLNRSLVTKNIATSEIGKDQNVINGPLNGTDNPASSDLAPATFYAEVQGPLPANTYSEAANSLYDNEARFLVRLPDAPNTKGLLAGSTPGIGHGGTNVIQGNYWGETQANVTMDVVAWNRANTTTKMETFFVAGDPAKSWLPFLYYPEAKDAKDLNRTDAEYRNMFTGTDLRTQGPFESIGTYMYIPIPLEDDDATSIPENLLFSGKIYDMYDKGTDIKTADYSNRRMSPIEDFAVGIPPKLRKFDDTFGAYEGNYVIKWTRDPAVAESGNYPGIAALQDVYFAPDENGVDHHPVGYPLYLQANVDYSGDENRTNHNDMFLNESVFFVINEANNDFIRVNLKQVGEEAPYREVFRNTVELVPDLSLRLGDNDKNRYINRRLDEGLKTLGNGADMLRALTVNPYDEDFAALKGRKYHADYKSVGQNHTIPTMVVQNLFSNRDNMPTTNVDGNNNMVTYFAGERYKALPVKVGDTVRVISRTELWRIQDESEIDAVMKGGLKFVVSESTNLPEFTGEVVDLQNREETIIVPSDKPWKDYDTVVVDEFKNRKFIVENTENDNILTVTAVDEVKMYDPNSVWTPADAAELYYEWNVVEANSALERWIDVVSVNADQSKDGANGYIRFEGQPINPFVVPGGETIKVSASNYPPTYRLVDKLKANGVADDVIAKYIEIYPDYFNATVYDADPAVSTDNARFLQQDTIDVGSKFTQEYEFEIFVVDSIPEFIAYDEDAVLDPETIEKNGADWVIYTPTIYNTHTFTDTDAETIYGAGNKYYFGNDVRLNGYYEDVVTGEDVLVANVTDQLRFKMDINTTDENEDYSPAAAGWNFRYGQTSYGFLNITTKEADSDVFDGIAQTRPNWMADNYFTNIADFTTRGKVDIEVPLAEAEQLLNPFRKENPNGTGYLTNDTVFTVVANDGHSGVATQQYKVTVNYEPEILTETLPNAIQGREYNRFLSDHAKIEIFDANFDQEHKYVLLYEDNATGETLILPRDPMFPDGEVTTLDASMMTTPSWLKINSESGVLYGTPGLDDIEEIKWDHDGTSKWIVAKDITATVLVFDVVGKTTVDGKTVDLEMLHDIKQIDFKLYPEISAPEIISNIPTVCVEKGGSFSYDFIIRDKDFLRSGDTITVKVYEKDTGAEVTEIAVSHPIIYAHEQNSDEVVVTISATDFDLSATSNNRLDLIIRAESKFWNDKGELQAAEVPFSIGVSDETIFTADITVENANKEFQVLQFGVSDVANCTIGDGTNNDDYAGQLDGNLCEFELPPTPPLDVFDARWKIPLRNGTLRSIHPYTQEDASLGLIRSVYECKIQAGGVHNGSSTKYPVTISWRPTDLIDWDGADNPNGGTWVLQDPKSNGHIFQCDMRNPDNVDYRKVTSNIEMGWSDVPGEEDVWVVTINRSDIDGFIIDYLYSGVSIEEEGILETEILSVSPNPMTTESSIKFAVVEPTALTIDVIDNLGRVVTTLENNALFVKGMHTIEWNGRNSNNEQMVSGQYMIRLNANGKVSTYPVVIVK